MAYGYLPLVVGNVFMTLRLIIMLLFCVIDLGGLVLNCYNIIKCSVDLCRKPRK